MPAMNASEVTTRNDPRVTEHFDLLIIGAGLSGIGAAVHLKRGRPKATFAILEARETIGGTWDLFRYPGIRSDSDMYTLGYSFKPWKEEKAIADGPAILHYIEETARENGVDRLIRYGHRVVSASWSSDAARWTVEAERPSSKPGSKDGPKSTVRLSCNFLQVCTGYYDYDAGYTPDFPGIARFKGQVVHPQKWTNDIDYAGKRVVVIGSGATAVTLVPELTKRAAHVVMLQRTPTYVMSRPAEDAVANALRHKLPPKLAYSLSRWKNVLLSMLMYEFSQRRPAPTKKWVIDQTQKALGPDFDVAKHFTPTYGVWDQRLCLVPDNDLFDVIRAGSASVVTEHIETFTETGIRLASGEELKADLVVTATGLVLKFAGGMKLVVDGRPVEPSKLLNYKGAMFSDVPNMACTFGYTNASWTLKADLTSEYLLRLLRHMDAIGAHRCTPRRHDPTIREEPFFGLTSGYVQRALSALPKQGSKRPWRLYQNYLLDLFTLRFDPIDDGTMEFV